LKPGSAELRSQYSKCVKQLSEDVSLKRLPNIRATVDERVCDPVDLCEGSDPGQCADKGTPRTGGFSPGDVTKCYSLIDEAKAATAAKGKAGPDEKAIKDARFKEAALLDRVKAECVNQERWKDHVHQVKLVYCMWKHEKNGACTNNLQTNCPTDGSCCPDAQREASDADSSADAQLKNRPKQYVCQKSPVVGFIANIGTSRSQ